MTETVDIVTEGGGELTIAAMDEGQRREIGRKTYRFALRCRQNPEIWALVKAKEAQLRAEGFFDRVPPPTTRAGSV